LSEGSLFDAINLLKLVLTPALDVILYFLEVLKLVDFLLCRELKEFVVTRVLEIEFWFSLFHRLWRWLLHLYGVIVCLSDVFPALSERIRAPRVGHLSDFPAAGRLRSADHPEAHSVTEGSRNLIYELICHNAVSFEMVRFSLGLQKFDEDLHLTNSPLIIVL